MSDEARLKEMCADLATAIESSGAPDSQDFVQAAAPVIEHFMRTRFAKTPLEADFAHLRRVRLKMGFTE